MQFEKELFRALFEANRDCVVALIEAHNIDINGHSLFSDENSILIESLLCHSDYRGSIGQLEIVTYLIENGAELNWKNKLGRNALHIALEYHDLSKVALVLIDTDKIDVNVVEDKNGNSPIFTAIREYGKTWRAEQKELNGIRFEIIEALLKRGTDMDKVNHHGISARRWIEISNDEKLHGLIEKHDAK